MNIRNRIIEYRTVEACELRPNPKNWRTHPKAQQDALRGVLAEVGIADAVLARKMPDGSLMLIDGHLRTETMPDQKIPVLVLDVNEDEADKLLATLDPLAAMAQSDAGKLDELLRNVNTGNEALQSMIANTHDDSVQQQLKQIAQEGDASEDEDDEDDKIKEYSQFSVPLTAGQEGDIRAALRIAKSLFKTESSGEALAALCSDWRGLKEE